MKSIALNVRSNSIRQLHGRALFVTGQRWGPMRANELCTKIHDRMPIILSPDDHYPWLSADADPGGLRELLELYPAQAMTAYPVSKALGNVKNDNPELIEPISA